MDSPLRGPELASVFRILWPLREDELCDLCDLCGGVVLLLGLPGAIADAVMAALGSEAEEQRRCSHLLGEARSQELQQELYMLYCCYTVDTSVFVPRLCGRRAAPRPSPRPCLLSCRSHASSNLLQMSRHA